jgi:3alpha(or 20beta)-hydroxysteroid dehydrogenase
MGRLEGKVALISGGARGIGATAARLFASEGASVVLGDVLDGDAKATADEIGANALALRLDVTSEEDWAAAVAEAEARFGRLDVLVNNAGILAFGTIEGTSPEDFMRIVRVNQLGAFLGLRAAVPAMRRAGGGSIVNVSSVEGITGGPALAAYASTKFAVRGLTKVGAVELGPHKIRVNAVCPGGIDTPMVRGSGTEGMDLDALFAGVPLGRAGRPDDVANVMLFLASDDSSYCNGAEFVVDGGVASYANWISPVPKM